MQAVTVGERHWMDNTRFAELLAVANALPGPIATKMAGVIGYQTGGLPGLLAAVSGVVLPSLLLLLSFYGLLLAYHRNPYVQGLIRGVRPVVVALLVLLVWDLLPPAFPRERLGATLGFFVLGLAALKGLRLPPALVMVAAMAAGAWLLR
ncbi:MAG: chromate transporter [Firmicutes bacterium]|nr:chromate transporter [Bacillota bacterium]